ncbi:hypothetical protein G4B88_003057 [Cannabis sativa]|uniref:Ycf2 N-terminal domain-containing protein n=1 Tax=Cannabis sativa TaxID=3483 RepID=A0A7J6H207_CANSA|nr:hypothetical protein G4B88_003057 [Cannabis sativa]
MEKRGIESKKMEKRIAGQSIRSRERENRRREKRESQCLWAISNETVAGIEISFKEKDTKYLEFLFVYYMDDLIREDHDWELFDRLSPRKRRNIINLRMNIGFEFLVKFEHIGKMIFLGFQGPSLRPWLGSSWRGQPGLLC